MKEKEFKNVRWGDIYYCDLGVTNGSVQSGMRPVLVVQTNRLNESSPTVVVAAITAVKKKTAMNTHIELNTDCGLKEPSMVMLSSYAPWIKPQSLIILSEELPTQIKSAKSSED